MLKLLSAGVSFSCNFLACRGGLGKRRIFRAVRRYRMADRVPGAVQRCLRCSAEPGPILTRLHGRRITGAVDLTFASVLPRVLQANVKSKTAPEINIASVPLVLTFVNEPSAAGYECQNRGTSASRRGVARRAASGARWRHAVTFPRHVLPRFCLIMSLIRNRGRRECRARQAHPQPRMQ